jgi:hypothetical protein
MLRRDDLRENRDVEEQRSAPRYLRQQSASARPLVSDGLPVGPAPAGSDGIITTRHIETVRGVLSDRNEKSQWLNKRMEISRYDL